MIQKTIKIGDVEETFRGTAATPIRYKRAFGEDMIQATQGMTEDNPDLEVAQKLAFAMSESCKKGMDFEEWLEQFAFMDFAESLEEIMELIVANSKTYQPPSPKKAIATEK